MRAAMKQLLEEFKAFVMRGNVIELAVAVVIGTAFTDLVKAATATLITPVVGLVLAGKGIGFLDFTYLKLGSFLMACVNFLITAAVVFFLFVKPLNKLAAIFGKKDDKPTPPATLNDVVAELKDLKEEIKNLKGQPTPGEIK